MSIAPRGFHAGSWSGSGASAGTGASSACLAAALACLSSTIADTLGDARAAELLGQPAATEENTAAVGRNNPASSDLPSSPSSFSPAGNDPASTLGRLRELSDALSAGKPLPAGPVGPAAPPAPPPPERPVPGQRPNLRVDRTAGWLKESGARISGLLAQASGGTCA